MLRRVDQHRLATPAGAGALGEFHGIAHGVNPDFLAGLAFLIVDFRLCLLAQRPAPRQHVGFGHQHTQVGMCMHIHTVATGALPAGTVVGGLLAQPGAHHGHAQLKLPHARGALQQPGMPALGQQRLALALQPRGQLLRLGTHAALPGTQVR